MVQNVNKLTTQAQQQIDEADHSLQVLRGWKAVFLVYNMVIRLLLETVGKKQGECGLDCGVVEAVYRLFPPGQLGQPKEEA